MAEDTGAWIITLASIHYVLAAERALQEHGIRARLIPAPKEFSADCGMALTISPADSARVREILDGPRWGVRGFHRREGDRSPRVED